MKKNQDILLKHQYYLLRRIFLILSSQHAKVKEEKLLNNISIMLLKRTKFTPMYRGNLSQITWSLNPTLLEI